MILVRSRQTLSQFWSFKIRRTTFLNYINYADLLIFRLLNCERVRRDKAKTQIYSFYRDIQYILQIVKRHSLHD